MTSTADDSMELNDRLTCSGPRPFVPDADPKLYCCAYCGCQLFLLPHEFRVCQTRVCIDRAIADRDERISQIQLAIPVIQAQLASEKSELIGKISELEVQDPESFVLAQYKALLISVNANLGFYAENECIDKMLVLKEQIRELSKRLNRPSFSDEFRQYLWDRDRKTCYLCTKVILTWNGDSMHVDHVRARSEGGSDEPYNLRIAHPICNLRKGDRALHEKRMKRVLEDLRKAERTQGEGELF